MSILPCLPLLECVYCLAWARWAWKRCLHSAGHDNETWGLATAEEFEPVSRLCRYILSVYEDDQRHPLWEPPGGYGINPDWVILRKTYEDTHGRAPPYILYQEHDHSDIILAIGGLNLAKESDYAVLLDNKLGKRKIDGGYVRNGLLKAAGWILDAECEILKELVKKYPNYTLTFAGHSLGSGVAAMLTLVVVLKMGINWETLKERGSGAMLLHQQDVCRLIWQSDMQILLILWYYRMISYHGWPHCWKTFSSRFSVCLRCMRDTCIPEEKMLKDPRRLYAPGRLYHIVERKPFGMGRFPPVVRTAVPVDGRFEHIVLSCNNTSDHAIIWIEREATRTLDVTGCGGQNEC